MSVDFVFANDETGAGARVLTAVPGKAPAWPAGADKADREAVAAWWKTRKAGPGETFGAEWAFGGLRMPTLLVWWDERGGAQARWRAWAAAGRALALQKSVARAAVWPSKGADGLEAAGLLYGVRAPRKERDFAVCWTGGAWKKQRAALARAETVARTQNELRALADRPACELSPEAFAGQLREWAAATPGMSCKIWDAAALREAGCGAILGVSAGSAREPRLVKLSWKGASKRKGQKPLALVGKGVTFDAGGICLKPAKGMEWMQYDKGGAIAVAGAVLAAARLGTARPLTAWIPLADNLPGGAALKPGDIVTARNGTTIQVLNTDAEGRLLLADALCMAAEEKPAAIVDVATLTGAVVIALGRDGTAVLGDDDVCAALETAADAAGERLWRLPLWPEFDAALESPFADCKNMGDGTGGTITAAAFLRRFVPAGIPWAHLDIAGTGWLEKDASWGAPGATAAAMRLLLEWAGTER